MKYRVIGLMSGTSMDGLDLAYCEFVFKMQKWDFKIIHSETIPYSKKWLKHLNNARQLSKKDLAELDLTYGVYLGQQVNNFIRKEKIFEVDFIASHGHTVHHQPAKGITVQIGNGEEISKHTGKTVVCDFRVQDVKLGGQGAPLVPIGDKLLFSEFDACVNLGGFVNVSFDKQNQRLAFDICPVNIMMNYMTQKIGLKYDESGDLARKGEIISGFLMALNQLHYYAASIPKSLGIEWVEAEVYPLIKNEYVIQDVLRTMVEHVAIQISKGLDVPSLNHVLVSGGGAFNTFLMERIRANSRANFSILGKDITEFKEAMVFAFLGVLRMRNENNILKSVTGASIDHCAGEIFRMPIKSVS
tara:strand:- start:17935 stop:19008 length:1074 start_codon:yes stop_codon:yes gene_type:complete